MSKRYNPKPTIPTEFTLGSGRNTTSSGAVISFHADSPVKRGSAVFTMKYKNTGVRIILGNLT